MTYKEKLADIHIRVTPETKKDLEKLYIIEGFSSLTKLNTYILREYVEKRRNMLDNNFIDKLIRNIKIDKIGYRFFWLAMVGLLSYISIILLYITGIDQLFITHFASILMFSTTTCIAVFLFTVIYKLVFYNVIYRNPNKIAKKIASNNKIVTPTSITPLESFHIIETEYGNIYLKKMRAKTKDLKIEYDENAVRCIKIHPDLTSLVFIEI